MNIFCIMGCTASGKDTVVNEVLKSYDDIAKVVPITTRPRRKNELNGVDYFFYNNKHYFAINSQQMTVQAKEALHFHCL